MMNRREFVIGISAAAATCAIEPVRAINNLNDSPVIDAILRAGTYLDTMNVSEKGRKVIMSLATANQLQREMGGAYSPPVPGTVMGWLDRFEVIISELEYD